MFVEGVDEHWSPLEILSEEVSVKLSVFPAEFVRLIFIIVSLQVPNNFRRHMGVIWARSNARAHHRAHVLMAFSCNQPAWKNDEGKVCQYKNPSLFTGLDLEGMQMHVELRPDIRVKNSIDVFEVDSSGLLVWGVWQRIRFVEPTSHGLQVKS